MRNGAVQTSARQPGILSILAQVPARHPTKLAVGFLWIFGLYALFVAQAPVKISEASLQAYKNKLREADSIINELTAAETTLIDAELRLRKVSVWFWRFRPRHRGRVQQYRQPVLKAKERVNAISQKRNAILREAKAALGLWSDAGLEETRSLLWNSFDSGKVFAQRQTFWDTLFNILDSRDKDWVFLLLQTLFTALMNYTVGTIISIVMFASSLPVLISSFKASFLSGAAFYFVAVVSIMALVASYLFLLYGAGAAVVYTTSSFVLNQQRLSQGRSSNPTLRYGTGYRQHHYE